MAWPFVFFDENGKRVTYTAQMVMDTIYKLDYNYDDTPVRPKAGAPEVKSLLFFNKLQDTILKQKVAKRISGNELRFSVTGKTTPVKLFGTDENQKNGSKIVLLTVKSILYKKSNGFI
jgi:hypothetical protein